MKHPARMDLNGLQIFDAIYTKGGVTAAAHHLNLTQSAVSQALKRLRQTFGDPLFVRHGSGLVPTAIARSIAEPINSALNDLQLTLENASSFDPTVSDRTFRIGLRIANENSYFPNIAARFLAEAPNAKLTSVAFKRHEVLKALASGDIDVVIDVAQSHDSRICHLPLGSDPLLVSARVDHPDISMGMDLNTYTRLSHVLVTARPRGNSLEDIALERLGSRRNVKIRCQNAFTAWKIVNESNLICTLPSLQARMLKEIWPTQLFDLPFPVSEANNFIYWHESTHSNLGCVWLRKLITDVMR